MKYRMFARSAGVRVSELALGAGMFGRAVEPDATHAVLSAYGDPGGPFPDTAPGYASELSGW